MSVEREPPVSVLPELPNVYLIYKNKAEINSIFQYLAVDINNLDAIVPIILNPNNFIFFINGKDIRMLITLLNTIKNS